MEKWFLRAGRLEGLSFLALLLIAMPLKYYGGLPTGVRILGPVHGLLFVAYVGIAILVSGMHGWRLSKLLLALIAAVLPCGTFLFERKYFSGQPKPAREPAHI